MVLDVRPEFKNNLENFVTIMLTGKNLVTKAMVGETVKTRDLLFYLQTYLRVFQDGTLPEITTLVQVNSFLWRLICYLVHYPPGSFIIGHC